jgi:SAM-dependent methyltransferase
MRRFAVRRSASTSAKTVGSRSTSSSGSPSGWNSDRRGVFSTSPAGLAARLYLARDTGCEIVGVELYPEAVTAGNRQALEASLAAQARFVRADASEPLPFESGTFDSILCIDAINHLPDRGRVIADWLRLLRPGGRLLFSDPLVVTGALGSDEIAIRTSIGYGLFVPVGENERLLAEARLYVLAVEDTTEQMADVARRRHDARITHEENLRRVEGDEVFEGRQRFFAVAARLSGERRLSRYVYVGEKPGNL